MDALALLTTEQSGARCSIVPNEILLPDARIRVDLRYAAPPETARDAISRWARITGGCV
jgi:hypothetical protein